MITVRVLPRSFDAEHVKHAGENIFCDQWAGSLDEDDCSGVPEVEIVNRFHRRSGDVWEKWTLRLCREHAGYLARQLQDAITLADGGDIMRAREPS
ncbi:MAG TPA: hypothetical protein VLI07_18675 [Candidatus Binatus sp.]|nr:hypothetical protein [Candidatus Binatus sp.]